MIRNVSFIIVVLNEEFSIRKCLNSIYKMSLSDCEIICVDSGSTDNTLSIIESFKNKFVNLRIFLIKGYANSAVARNVGIRYSSKELIFFVDGDIELNENFIINAINRIGPEFFAITGNLKEIQYSSGYQMVKNTIESLTDFKYEKRIYYSGGTFIIKRDVIKIIGNFDEKFERSQDFEFTLRLTRKFKMLAVVEQMGIHHTIPYHNRERLVKSFKKWYPVYLGMIIRRNITNFRGLFAYMFGSLKGITAGFGLWIFFVFMILFLSGYFKYLIIMGMIIFDVIHGFVQKKDIVYRFFLHYIAPIYLFIGIFKDINPLRSYSIIELNE